MEHQAADILTKYAGLADIVVPQLVTWAVNVAGALAILIIGWIIARIAARIARHLLNKNPHMEGTIKPFLANLVRYTILILVVYAAIAQMGVPTASILAVLGAAGLAVGLALQGTLSNIAAGVMLLVLRPIRLEEYINADGIAGTVKEVGLFTTTLHSPDGLCLFVPNAKLSSATIQNYSRLGRRRLDLGVGIAYEADIDNAREVLLGVLKDEPRLLADTPPDVFVSDLGDSAVVLNMRGWTSSADYLATVADLKRTAKYALDKAGINIPFPQRVVHIAGNADEAASAGVTAQGA
jgi:small conductance mechanosensitive channel